MRRIIAVGAEAVLEKLDGLLLKKRIKKGYRHPELDIKLRKGRTRREGKILQKAADIVNVPDVKEVLTFEIKMDFIEGKLLSLFLDLLPLAKAKKICGQLGEEIAALHNKNIIHGDLTTSNMIFSKGKVYLIDFGLGFYSGKVEGKAVDLHLLQQAFESKHFSRWEKYIQEVLKSYKKKNHQAEAVFKRLEQVVKRGRYKRKGKRKGKI